MSLTGTRRANSSFNDELIEVEPFQHRTRHDSQVGVPGLVRTDALAVQVDVACDHYPSGAHHLAHDHQPACGRRHDKGHDRIVRHVGQQLEPEVARPPHG